MRINKEPFLEDALSLSLSLNFANKKESTQILSLIYLKYLIFLFLPLYLSFSNKYYT